jgi:hypothetical protein
LREPVVHFFVIGLFLFLLHSRVSPKTTSRRETITQEAVQALVRQYEKARGHPPSGPERALLIEQHIRDEVLFREALAMGLHMGDIVVRRRLIQTMEFLAEGTTPIAEPTDSELSAYLLAHASEYRSPAQLSLAHVFVSRNRPPEDARKTAQEFLHRLRAGEGEKPLGDPFLRGSRFSLKSEKDLGATFGPAFAREAFSLPLAEWSGPVESSYGLHLVRVDARREERLPDVREVRERLRNELLAERRKEESERAIRKMVLEYQVRIEGEPSLAKPAGSGQVP